MTQRLVAGLLAALFMACPSGSFAQEKKYPEVLDAKPRFKTLPNHTELAPTAPAATLTQWNGSFTDLTGKKITYTMVGTDPSTGGVSTTVPLYIIPIKMDYGKANGNHTFDPVKTTVSNGLTVVNNVIASPIFNPGVNFTQGGTNLGTTQYIDAFQRGNFWKSVHKKANSGYHVLLGTPTVLKEQSITVSATLGQVVNNPFGSGIVGTYDINAFDGKLQTYMKKFSQLNPGVLPLFITYNIYLTEGGDAASEAITAPTVLNPAGKPIRTPPTWIARELSRKMCPLSRTKSGSGWTIRLWTTGSTVRITAFLKWAIRWKATPTTELTRTRSADSPTTCSRWFSSAISERRKVPRCTAGTPFRTTCPTSARDSRVGLICRIQEPVPPGAGSLC